MANTTGAEVAKLSVKVSPDTTHFREDLRRRLQAVERALAKEGIDVGDVDVDTDKAEKKVKKSSKKMSNSLGALTKEAKKASVAVNKVKLNDVSKDINRNISALDRFAGAFDVKNPLFWDPKEGKAALKALTDGQKNLKTATDRATRAAKAQQDALFKKNSLKIKPSKDIDASIAKLYGDAGKIDVKKLAQDAARSGSPFIRTGNTAKMDAEFDKSVNRMQEKLNTLDLKWDKKVQKFRMDTHEIVASLADVRAETERINREFEIAKQKAKEASDETDRVFKNASRRDMRAALRDYVYGLRDINYEAQQARESAEKMKQAFYQAAGPLNRLKNSIVKMNSSSGKNGKGGAFGGGLLGGLLGGGGSGGFRKPKWLTMPSFGSGINPAGYAVIIAGLALVAAPLVGLVSALVLAIPGMISAIATPMMAIGLGLDGIKRAGANSGLFKYDEEGKLSGVGAVFDKVKKETSTAFDEGLTPSLKKLADSIDTLLGSLPKVATGLSDMFKGFIDSLTSPEGMRLFDDTISNIGAAMSQAAPGMRSFTDGMLNIANAFSQKLPGLSNWFNRTGDSFAKWVDDLTKVPDPAGHHGPNGRSRADLAFTGLGDTLRTIGDWVVDMGNAGLKFVTDPKKMADFIETLNQIGEIITGLVNLGNALGPVWDIIAKISGNEKKPSADDYDPRSTKPQKVPVPDVPEPPKPAVSIAEDGERVSKAIEEGGKGFWENIKDWFGGGKAATGNGSVLLKIGNEVLPGDADWGKIASTVKSETDRINSEIAVLEQAIWARTDGGFKQSSSDAVNRYRSDLEDLKADLAKVQETAAQIPLGERVGLTSSESPLPGTSFVDQLITDLESVPAAAIPAKDALQQVKDTGVLTPEALGQLSENAQASTAAPAEVPAPDTSAFDSVVTGLPASMEEAMGAVTAAVTAGGDDATAAAQASAEHIAEGMNGMSAKFQSVGFNMMSGVAQGIAEGKSMAIGAAAAAALEAYEAAKGALDINSPSKKFIEIGMSTMEGMSKGMENGVGQVMDQAKDLANKVAHAFADGSDPTEALKGMSVKEINRMEKLLGWDSKTLGRQIKANNALAKSTGNGSFKAEAERLQILKDEVDASKEMLDLANEFNDSSSSGGGEDPFVKGASQLMNSPVDFAKATGKQFMSDLGIGGNGLIGNAITEGISYIFNIASVDEALSLKDRQDSKASQSSVGR